MASFVCKTNKCNGSGVKRERTNWIFYTRAKKNIVNHLNLNYTKSYFQFTKNGNRIDERFLKINIPSVKLLVFLN